MYPKNTNVEGYNGKSCWSSRAIIFLAIGLCVCLTIVAITMAGFHHSHSTDLDDRLTNHIEKMDKHEDDATGESKENETGDEQKTPTPESEQYLSNCKEIKENRPDAESGVYKMILKGTLEPVSLYCDMTSAGGGWTLVYSYGFTNYENFQSGSNAVTPIPNWKKGLNQTLLRGAEVSTTPPLSENERGALAFNLWDNIGSEFMVKSTINNWITCKPGSGSLVTLKGGSITCQTIHETVDCKGELRVPDRIVNHSMGPSLYRGGNHFNFWEGNTKGNWPVVDPCGETRPNHKTDVADPRGAVFIK